jgi:hypothetical protein
MTSTGGAVVIAAARNAERRLVRALRDQGATSADHAIPLAASRPGGRMALKRLIRGGAIREADGRHWLDERAYEALGDTRRVRTVFALIVVLLILAGVLGVMMLRG